MSRASITGFVIGAALPVGWDVYVIAHDEWVNHTSMSLGSEVGYCGLGYLSACLAILIAGPVCGAIGAAILSSFNASKQIRDECS